MKHSNHHLSRIALTSAVIAAMWVGATSADVAQSTKGLPSGVVQYQMELDRQQRSLDHRQAVLDRQQAALDRRKARYHGELANAKWRFRMLDTDDNARISQAEAQAVPTVDSLFDTLDDDGNGRLTVSEYRDITPFMSGAPMTTR